MTLLLLPSYAVRKNGRRDHLWSFGILSIFPRHASPQGLIVEFAADVVVSGLTAAVVKLNGDTCSAVLR